MPTTSENLAAAIASISAQIVTLSAEAIKPEYSIDGQHVKDDRLASLQARLDSLIALAAKIGNETPVEAESIGYSPEDFWG